MTSAPQPQASEPQNPVDALAPADTALPALAESDARVSELLAEPGKEKVTYVKMTPEKAVRVVNDHIVNGNPVAEFTVGAIKD